MEAEQKIVGASQHEFCHARNIDTAVAYLSQELTLVGLPAVMVSGRQGQLDAVAIVNTTWQLLQYTKDGLAQRQELQHRLNCAGVDKEQLEVKLSRCRDQFSAMETRSAQQLEKQRQLAAQLSSSQTQLTEAKDESRRLQSLLQQRAAHYQHELKKQERQTERLKDMTRRLMDRGRAGGAQTERPTMIISGLLGRTDGSRARWRTPASADRAKEEAYERVLAGCEVRYLRLVGETQRLRTLLASLLKALVTACEQVSCADRCPLQDHQALVAGLELGLPYDPLSDQLDDLVSYQLDKLSLLLTERDGASPAAVGADPAEQGAEELLQRLEEAERTVQEQRFIIEASTGGDTCDDSFQRNAFFVEEREELAMRERLLEEQRQALARERAIYTEAALRLGRERMAFEAERTELKKLQFLASSPLPSRRPASARASASEPIGVSLRVQSASPASGPSADRLLRAAGGQRLSAPDVPGRSPSVGQRTPASGVSPLSRLGLPGSLRTAGRPGTDLDPRSSSPESTW